MRLGVCVCVLCRTYSCGLRMCQIHHMCYTIPQTYLCGESKEVTHYLDERGELSSEFDGLLVKFLCLFEKNTFSSAEMAQDTQQTVKSHHKAIEHLQSRTDMSTNDAENESRDVKGGDAGLKYLTSSQVSTAVSSVGCLCVIHGSICFYVLPYHSQVSFIFPPLLLLM